MKVKGFGTAVVSVLQLANVYAEFKRWRSGLQAVILMYHRVSPDDVPWLIVPPVSPAGFEAQLRYLHSHFEVMSLDDLFRNVFRCTHSGRRIASITFDDGYRDNFSYAFPLLKKYGMPATIFLPTGLIDSHALPWWDKVGYALTYTRKDKLSLGELGDYAVQNSQRRAVALKIIRILKKIPDAEKNKLIDDLIRDADVELIQELAEQAMLSWDSIMVMAKDGIFFGAHSVNHPILTNTPLEVVDHEVRQSKTRIEDQVGLPVNFFAYPDGAFNSDIAKVVERIGFSGAVTMKPFWVTDGCDPFVLGRMGVSWDDLDMFRVMLSGMWGDWKKWFGNA
jgi:peptidoglycan/xylan/chitin deacetylase (PgdA/CDA1 family)